MYPRRVRIKFCGITSEEDALSAVNLGVDAIGFIFHQQSKRYINIDVAQHIAQVLPPFVTKVAVLLNEDSDYINAILKKVPIDVLQFHGDESAAFCRSFIKPYIKTIHMAAGQKIGKIEQQYPDALGFLFDTQVGAIRGGSGVTFDWQQIPTEITKPVILAGGLTPANVKAALQTVNPYAVDVTSGIEISHGVKDIQKMQDFVATVMDYSRNA